MSIVELSTFVIVTVIVVGWFAFGTQYNLYKGKKTLEWLQDGLRLLGDRTSLRWLGTAAVELKIQNAKEPFRHAEVVIALEPRDVAFLWWYYRLRGRRDLLILRGQLRAAPGFEFEALNPNAWSARGIESKLQFRNWNPLPAIPAPLVAYAAGRSLPATELAALMNPAGCQPVRIAIHRTEPNIEIHWNLAEVRKVPAETLLEAVRQIPPRLLRTRQ